MLLQVTVNVVVEMQLVNSIVPFTILNTLWSEITSRPSTTTNRTEPRFVVNVAPPEVEYAGPHAIANAAPHRNMARVCHCV